MMQGIQYPPKTIMEVYKALPEGTLAEIIEGKLYMSPSLTTSHQKVHKQLLLQLERVIEKAQIGQVWYAPHDVFLDANLNVVQPDLFVILNDHLKFIEEDGIHGSPDFIIEIISPNNLKHDTVTKKALYEKFGVKEYWVIDPKSKRATGYQLVDDKFEEMPTLVGKIKSILLGCEIVF